MENPHQTKKALQWEILGKSAPKLKHCLEFLKGYGYESPSLEKGGKEGEDQFLKFTYLAPKTHRIVKLFLGINSEDILRITPLIENTETLSNFLLVTWLRRHGKRRELANAGLAQNIEQATSILETFSKDLEALAQGDLGPFLRGEDWEEVPFDWTLGR